jgi:hypothetical protein
VDFFAFWFDNVGGMIGNDAHGRLDASTAYHPRVFAYRVVSFFTLDAERGPKERLGGPAWSLPIAVIILSGGQTK